ncbi:M48 metallopeptidase family protein [Rhizobium sp. NLR17b]|uniref:M48 metallopeptidase family protein n=1 Tax=unclassified Rhizobium TaxID=2613769 RepID=UPI00287F77FE|nr:M48 family metallopeptidase [Rhizobium sp. NLR17b]
MGQLRPRIGKINLNWHLIVAPKPALEYAVVHEMCHLNVGITSRSFGHLSGPFLPDWAERKAWLDKNEHLLGWETVESAA